MLNKIYILILFLVCANFAQTLRDLDLYKGDSHTISFEAPYDVSSDSLLFVVKADRDDSTPRVIALRNTAGGGSDSEIEVIYSAVSTILVKLTQINTEGLTAALYVYDLTIDSTTTLYTGTLKLRDEVGGSADGVATRTPYYTVATNTPGYALSVLAGYDSDNSVSWLSKSAFQDTIGLRDNAILQVPMDSAGLDIGEFYFNYQGKFTEKRFIPPTYYIGYYAGQIYLSGGGEHIDIVGTIDTLEYIGANTYFYIIKEVEGGHPHHVTTFPEFLDSALAHNIAVWAYFAKNLLPYEDDFISAAEYVATLSLSHSNLMGWIIDDFWSTSHFWMTEDREGYVDSFLTVARDINPDLKFYALTYQKHLYIPYSHFILNTIDGIILSFPPDSTAMARVNDSYDTGSGDIFNVNLPFGGDEVSREDFSFLSQPFVITDSSDMSITFHYASNYTNQSSEGFTYMEVHLGGKIDTVEMVGAFETESWWSNITNSSWTTDGDTQLRATSTEGIIRYVDFWEAYKVYQVSLTVASYSGAGAGITLHDGSRASKIITANGTYDFRYTPETENMILYSYANSECTVSALSIILINDTTVFSVDAALVYDTLITIDLTDAILNKPTDVKNKLNFGIYKRKLFPQANAGYVRAVFNDFSAYGILLNENLGSSFWVDSTVSPMVSTINTVRKPLEIIFMPKADTVNWTERYGTDPTVANRIAIFDEMLEILDLYRYSGKYIQGVVAYHPTISETEMLDAMKSSYENFWDNQ